ncbi:MAG TPA: acyltransferase [Pyrinomonadaceae bacterium]|nr:acyltransferase [Pyrinomonadaceae bacterium]
MSFKAAFRERLAGIYELDSTGAKRSLQMEGVRGFAVLLVFFVHYHALFKPWMSEGSFTFALSDFLWSIGHTGVDLFFVLSGYLIYGLVIKRRNSYPSFIKRRILRIYPVFLCVLAIYIALSLLFPSENKIPAGAGAAGYYILQNVLLLPGMISVQPIITVSWSLSYEFFFYLFIPALVALLAMRRWTPALRVLFFLTLAVVYAWHCFASGDERIRLIMFISGILLFEAMHSYNLGERVKPLTDYLVIAALALTFLMVYVLTGQQGTLSSLPNSDGFKEMYRTLVLFGSFGLLVLTCLSSNALLGKIFSWTPLRWLGNMSYSYYLIHGLTLKGIALVAHKIVPSSDSGVMAFLFGLPPAFGLTLISATLLFIIVEKRFSIPTGAKKQTRSNLLAPVESASLPVASQESAAT